jgi:type I restriction enzyme M protein
VLRDKFEDVFGTDPKGGPAALANAWTRAKTGRWRKFTREQIAARGDNLDISLAQRRQRRNGRSPARRARPGGPAAVHGRASLEELGGAMADGDECATELPPCLTTLGTVV